MKRNLIIVLVLLALGIILFTTAKPSGIPGLSSREVKLPWDSNISFSLPTLNTPGDSGMVTIEIALSTFEKYVNFAKEHDLVGLKSLSHQISPACSDPAKK